MLQRFKNSLAGLFSLGVLGTGCAHALPGPTLTVCILDPSAGGLECVDQTHKRLFVPLSDAADYIALGSEDFKALVTYCKLRP